MVTLAHRANVARGAVLRVTVVEPCPRVANLVPRNRLWIVGWLFGKRGAGASSAGWIWKKRGRKEKGLLDRIKGVPPKREAQFDVTQNLIMKGANR